MIFNLNLIFILFYIATNQIKFSNQTKFSNQIYSSLQTKQQCKLSYSSLIPLSTRYIESMKNNVLHSCRPPKPSCSTGPLTVLRAFKKTECARNSSFNGSIDSLENSSIVKIKVFAPEDSTVLSPSEHRSTSDQVVQSLVEHMEAHHHQTRKWIGSFLPVFL